MQTKDMKMAFLFRDVAGLSYGVFEYGAMFG